MDPINIIGGLTLISTFFGNYSSSKIGLKNKASAFRSKPKTYLQTIPLYLATITLVITILGLFQVGTIEYDDNYKIIRAVGLFLYIIFTWVQIGATKKLGNYYSQDVVVLKNHQVVKTGAFKIIRHPQYLAQILLDMGAVMFTLSYLLLPFVLIEIPVLILRALLEEKILTKELNEEYTSYKKKSGFMLPFIG